MEAKQFGYVLTDEKAKPLEVLVFTSELSSAEHEHLIAGHSLSCSGDLTLTRMEDSELRDFLSRGTALRDMVAARLINSPRHLFQPLSVKCGDPLDLTRS